MAGKLRLNLEYLPAMDLKAPTHSLSVRTALSSAQPRPQPTIWCTNICDMLVPDQIATVPVRVSVDKTQLLCDGSGKEIRANAACLAANSRVVISVKMSSKRLTEATGSLMHMLKQCEFIHSFI